MSGREKCRLELLPSKLLKSIIGHLKDFFDRQNIAMLSGCVSKLVQESDKTLENLSFEGCKANSIDLEDLEPILKRANKLKSLHLTNRNGSNVIRRIGHDAHFIITDNCPELTSLDASGVSIAPSELYSIVKKCRKIRTLKIINPKFDDQDELSLLSTIPHWSSIQLIHNTFTCRNLSRPTRRYDDDDNHFHDYMYYDFIYGGSIDPELDEDLKSKEEIQLADKLAFYDEWLAAELDSFEQKTTDLEWKEIIDGHFIDYVVKIKLQPDKLLFAQTIDSSAELELSESDEQGVEIWSARGRIHYDPYVSSQSNCLQIRITNRQGRNKTWNHIERKPTAGFFKVTNAKYFKSKIDIINDGLKRISKDYLLRSAILAKEKEFPKFENRNILKSVSLNIKQALDDNNDVRLNESQIEAINNSLCSRISLIMGPPGTGKTFTSAELALHLFKTKFSLDSKILICASSNVAVDIIADKIQELGKLRMVRLSSEFNIRKQDGNCKSYYLNSRVDYEVMVDYRNQWPSRDQEYDRRNMRGLRKKSEKKILSEAQVICCTCNSIPKLMTYGSYLFDSIIVDECSQISVPDGMLLLQFLPRRLVLVGDDNQLGPVIKDTLKKKYNCSNTVLYNKLKGVGFKPVMLNVQYRMHPEIVEFPNSHFYGGKIRNGIQPSDRQWTGELEKSPFPISDAPIYFHSHNFEESCRADSTSWINEGEMNIVINTILVLLSRGIQRNEIGVITPYKDQSECIRDKLSSDCGGNFILRIPPQHSIEVDTVDAYQGRDKDYIIVSLVRSKDCTGFIADRKRLNVTLTRAKYGLIIIGNALALSRNPLLDVLIQNLSKRYLLYSGILSEKSQTVTLNKLLIRKKRMEMWKSSQMRVFNGRSLCIK